jgi:hypothetical protein
MAECPIGEIHFYISRQEEIHGRAQSLGDLLGLYLTVVLLQYRGY